MTALQFDYSTLSTSLSQGDLTPSMVHNMIEGISEETSTTSEESVDASSVENSPRPLIPPVDRYSFVYIVFGLLGVGTLLPWNFFITAHDYWMYKFRNVSSQNCSNPNERTELQASFTTYLAVATNGSYTLFLIICAVFNEKFSQLRQVVSSLIAMIITFVTMTALVEVNTDQWQHEFFALTMVLVVLMGISSAVLQAAVAGVASVLPPRYMHVMVLGQALAGIVAALTQIATLMGHCLPQKSALGYFLSADMFILLMLLSYLWAHKSAFFQFHLHHSQGNRILKDVTSSSVLPSVSLLAVSKKIWPYATSVFLDFWVTIGIFPGLAVLVVSMNYGDGSPWTGQMFLPLACFILFNVGDLCGRILGGWIPFKPTWRFHLLAFSIVRIGFIPLFLLCNAKPRSHLPVIFSSDAYYIAFVAALGFSNGCLVTTAMISGTKYVSLDQRELSGVVLSAFIGMGLMFGSISSYVLVQML